MKALQWETNHRFRRVGIEEEASQSARALALQREVRPKRASKSKEKKRYSSAGRLPQPPAKRSRGDGAGPSKAEHKIPDALYKKRMAARKCFKCGMAGHMAGSCPVGPHDEHGNAL